MDIYLCLLKKLVLPFSDTVRGIYIQKERGILERSQWWSREELIHYQNTRIKKLISEVYSTVPYYRKVMIERDLEPGDIQTVEDLKKLPLLTKKDVRENISELKSTNLDVRKAAVRRTGGSTGEPITYYHDRKTQSVNRAAHHRGLSWGGYEWGQPLLQLFGGTLGIGSESFSGRLPGIIARQKFYPAFKVKKENVLEIADILCKNYFQALIGYTSSVYFLADILDKAGFRFKIPCLFTTGETIYDYQKELIEHVFNGKVYDYYGFGEIQAVAYQCPVSGYYHLSNEKVILETIPVHNNENNHLGRAVITDLTNVSFPFIRYEPGDFLELSEEKCDCGRGLTVIKKIHGRETDFIKLSNGNLLAGEFFPHLFGKFHTIEQYQIIQDRIDHLQIKYKLLSSESETHELELIGAKIREYTEGLLHVDFEKVNEISLTPSGKLRICISMV